jgi:hypothetical protein
MRSVGSNEDDDPIDRMNWMRESERSSTVDEGTTGLQEQINDMKTQIMELAERIDDKDILME